MAEVIVQLKKGKQELVGEFEEFKKRHSEAFLYFIEEYDKWRELKRAVPD